MNIALFDTSVCTENLGDFIIMDAIRDHINEMFPGSMVLHTATHDKVSRPTYRMVKKSGLSFVGGTNLISSNMDRYNQWKINIIDGLFLKNIILMGVGWWQYQKKPNVYTRYLLKSVLNHDVLHSVRDSYAEKMLRSSGFNNVINTSCATMWRLDEAHCSKIQKEKSENVVATLTDYNKDPKNDHAVIEALSGLYSKVYIWPQGAGDVGYIKSLGLPKSAEILPPKLEAYNSILLDDESIDFVGTRLHAGIRALQMKRRTIILGIDNRALEKSKDFNIKVVARDDLQGLKKAVKDNFETRINIPVERIEKWKSQFQ